jgi:uncharacterized RDD family membrane protein YckC
VTDPNPQQYGPPGQYGPPQSGPPARSGPQAQYGPPAHYGPPARFGPPPLPPGMSYAPWGRRALAYVVDVLLLFACFLPTLVVVGVIGAIAGSDDDWPVAGTVALILVMIAGLLAWLYQMTWRQGVRGQSWGKQLTGIHLVRVVDLRPPGGGVGIGRYAVNWALGNASCGIYSLVNAVWPLADDRNQSLDDKILNTLVVRLPG